ncbi:MAG: 23S rRNA (uracil(1939)-C(5))-methyltransferase RlmD [Endomicrobium sp.]|nr:23S rRNA (uracil(1939)-C(5))-methyltransferase RlmD [Endomicrobium sp.]
MENFNNMCLKNNVISVKSEKFVFPGRSLCRCSDGIVLFTDGLLPGESAMVLVTKDKKTFREGRLINVTSRSYERIDPLCSSFNLCGGCSFQNIPYEDQIKYKQEYITELLDFTGVKISSMLKSSLIWNYRNKMEFSFFNNNGVVDLGLHCKGSFDNCVSVHSCFIANENFARIIEIIRKFVNDNNFSVYNNKTHEGFLRRLILRKFINSGQFLINMITNVIGYEMLFLKSLTNELRKFSDSIYLTFNNDNNANFNIVSSVNLKLISGKSFVTEKLNICNKDYFFNISPFSFFQVNSKCAEILYSEIFKLLNPSKKDTMLDLYCGTGTISIPMAQNIKKIVCIDYFEQAIHNAKENAIINGVNNIEFYSLNVQDWIKKMDKNNFSIIIIDPPRSGITKNIIKFLINSNAEKIVYVSCNPSTLARDIKLILESGKYNVKDIRPVDMFPQTYHVEIISLLCLNI